jgi:indolepyruvate ferredoxin oxidoreductase alpha subunit
MPLRLILGNEAVAQGAIDAGIAGAFSYPGTPATEIFEYVAHGPWAKNGDDGAGRVSALWSANEKVAYEEALGMSYAGKRALVSMKHVGLNVAADPFINSALTGVGGGLVLVVADDPGMHSSQNEQDSRYYGELAQIPVFEPATQQAAYDLTLRAFPYSEKIGLPVMIRLVTRLAHSRANVAVQAPAEHRACETPPPEDPDRWTLVPAVARRRFGRLVELQKRLLEDSESSPANRLTLAGPRGVIAAGLAHNYVLEALDGGGETSILKLQHYPLPVSLIRELVGHCHEILVAEDGYPFIERRLNGLLGIPGKAIKGRLTGDLPATGELTPDALAAALGRPRPATAPGLPDLAARPPQLCRGCPHADSFKAIVEATARYAKPLMFSDIGCYTLGVLPPYRAVHACVDMGASIAMAHGASQAGLRPVICTIGDSTFAHSGMTPLLGAAQSNADMTVFILDNSTVAMTGAQDSMATGERLLEILRGLGVAPEHLHVIEPVPRRHAHNVDLIRREIEHPGLSVVIAARPCIHLARKIHLERREQPPALVQGGV